MLGISDADTMQSLLNTTGVARDGDVPLELFTGICEHSSTGDNCSSLLGWEAYDGR